MIGTWSVDRRIGIEASGPAIFSQIAPAEDS
jgi:hypothetical protein